MTGDNNEKKPAHSEKEKEKEKEVSLDKPMTKVEEEEKGEGEEEARTTRTPLASSPAPLTSPPVDLTDMLSEVKVQIVVDEAVISSWLSARNPKGAVLRFTSADLQLR